ncbi:immunoglobulin superfamily DCC subclass member 4 [Plutella xylostella]|uniref:immunoglobulin superfamily DCC subclass member 4 n=1 Tax=Plutella xylostella TaxID=51655 RepID=UPI002032BF9F|nr:immunoglobulin superfamily DCC subclass member 4 [Plutella xylostella]
MALLLLRVLLLGALAAAVDDVPVVWSAGRSTLACTARAPPRRAPPPLDADRRPHPVTWTHDGQEVPEKRISPDGSLEVRRRDAGAGAGAGGAGGVYQCAVRVPAGVVLGDPVHLKFATLEKQFSQHPENLTATAGQPVALSCRVHSAPPAHLAWTRDGEDLPEDPRYYILENQLLITDVREEDAGYYKCTATNRILNKTRTSHRGLLQVAPSSGAVEAGALQVSAGDAGGAVAVPRGGRALLPCPVRGEPRPELVWQWTPPGGRTAELDAVSQVLALTGVDLDQEGEYSCRVAGGPVLKTWSVSLTEPAVITIPPVSKEAVRAKTVRFNCTAEGRPTPNVAWYKDGRRLPLTGRTKVLKYEGRYELVISTITSDDAGVYQCFASTPTSLTSAWAALTVTGSVGRAPRGLRCRPAGARSLQVSWRHDEPSTLVAYTLHYISQYESVGSSTPYQPNNTEVTITVGSPLTPYNVQVRAYLTPGGSGKNIASDMSDTVVCQGQGVPISLVRLNATSVLVSWAEFSAATPGVRRWRLQTRAEGGEVETEELGGEVVNYTLTAPASAPLQVRVLGSRRDSWPPQDLSLVRWSSTARAAPPRSDLQAVPTDVEVSSVTPGGFHVSWARLAGDYVYILCVTKEASHHDQCQETSETSLSLDDLEPDSVYEVRVQARAAGRAGGAFSQPLVVTTPPTESPRHLEVWYRFVNSSAVQVWWSQGGWHTVRHAGQLRLPLHVWSSADVHGTNVTIAIDDKSNKTYVMVTGHDPEETSRVLTIDHPPHELKEMQYSYGGEGVRVRWSGARTDRYWVRFSQELTRPMEHWSEVTVTEPSVLLQGLDPSRPTYVMVTTAGARPLGHVLTVPRAPDQGSKLYLGIGVAAGVCVLCACAGAALCVWTRRKRARSPLRPRRRNPSTNESNEDASEMTNVGGRLANGGAPRGAGEPLLNGHVHITENPTLSKTPNGKPKKTKSHEPAFDLSRYSEADVTAETVLDLTPRTPGNASPPRARHKLPDDNMNCQLARPPPPLLQPNG